MTRVHDYGLPLRPKLVAALGVVGVLLAYLLHLVEGVVGDIPWWLDAPASVGFAMFLYQVLDRTLWHRRFVIDALRVPDLRGVWVGELQTSHDNFARPRPIKVEIHQTWTKMLVTLQSLDTGSSSHSRGAYIVDVGDGSFELVYEFLNEPSKTETGPLQMHRGTTVLHVSKDQQQLDGHYYTGRERMTHGALKLARAVDVSA